MEQLTFICSDTLSCTCTDTIPEPSELLDLPVLYTKCFLLRAATLNDGLVDISRTTFQSR